MYATKRNILINRLCAIENLRDMRGDWISATWNTIRLFPKAEQGKIKKFAADKQAENTKKVLETLEKMRQEMLTLLTTLAPTDEKLDDLQSKSQYLGQIRGYVASFDQVMAQLDFVLAASVLNSMWKLIDDDEERE